PSGPRWLSVPARAPPGAPTLAAPAGRSRLSPRARSTRAAAPVGQLGPWSSSSTTVSTRGHSWNQPALEHFVGDRSSHLVQELGRQLRIAAQHLDHLLLPRRLRFSALLPQLLAKSTAGISGRLCQPTYRGSGAARRQRRPGSTRAPWQAGMIV